MYLLNRLFGAETKVAKNKGHVKMFNFFSVLLINPKNRSKIIEKNAKEKLQEEI